MKLLWGSPLPPVRSGVSDYALEILEEIGAHTRVRVLEPPGWKRPEGWNLDAVVELVPGDTPPEDDEISLIHLGNNPHHLWLLDRLGGPRTVVVLHDLVLHHLLVEGAASRDEGAFLEERLRAAHGSAGEVLARARAVGLTGRLDPFLFPARGVFLDQVAGVVVHSQWGETIVRGEWPGLEIGRVKLAVADPGPADRTHERTRIGIADDDVVLMHLGFLTPEKGLVEILTGLAAAVLSGVQARLILVGEGVGLEDVVAAAADAGVGDRVVSTGWVDPQSFPTVPAAADVGVVLRTPSAGETSAAALRFLACGTPVAVGGLHQFLEWPERAAPRITPGSSTPAELARILAQAAQGGENWQRRRIAAREAYDDGHHPAAAAGELIRFLERF
jgi:glycosyltransferase involved in cell wall biosynthesis